MSAIRGRRYRPLLVGLAALAAGCGGGGGEPVAGDPQPRRTTTTLVPDDRYTAAYALPDVGDLGAGWVELNRDPGGRDDPTLPTAPQLGPDCGGQRAVDETGAAFALFERRRLSDLDEELYVYTLLFASVDDASAQAALYRSATFETCVLEDLRYVVEDFGGAVNVEDRPLPALTDGVDGAGRLVRMSVAEDGFTAEGRVETTVLRSGRAVALLLRAVNLGAPEPFTLDRLVSELADGLVYIAD